MTESGIGFLCATAATIGVVHTALGPDHYVPFIALSKARGWTLRQTLIVTLACGVGHVLGSVLLGAIGIAAGIAVFRLQQWEAIRGDLAGWLLLAFGLAYASWGFRQAVRHRPHEHWHAHADGTLHRHQHVHVADHAHVHPADLSHGPGPRANATPWILFLIFVFGPCEPLIPILMYPAAEGSALGVALVTLVFGLTTIATMLSAVTLAHLGFSPLRWAALERYTHALAGSVIAACGGAILIGL